MSRPGIRRIVVIAVVLLGLCGIAFAAIAYRPAIARVTRPDPRQFDPALVARGDNLARLGNCVSCHQAAGGRPWRELMRREVFRPLDLESAGFGAPGPGQPVRPPV